ncbi:hypothetical protein ACO0LF_15850 [Undibacterium sp. Di27W]|uniref:hypothetical protein n=1 Tax=Undibacterium sp. Di27W TaxID=3413036 RepID=UPI003BEFF40E
MTFSEVSENQITKDQVAIAITAGRFGSHTGIAFHSAKEGFQLLHLAWHKSLLVDSLPLDQCWIACVPEISHSASKQMVAIVRAIAKRRPSISYAVNVLTAKNSFDSNGHYSAPKGSHGLTCATFVTEIFRAAVLPLVDETTWKETAENIVWGNEVVDLLQRQGVSNDHVIAVRASVNGIRIRPDEVGAAGCLPFKKRPAKFEDISPITPTVMSKYSEISQSKKVLANSGATILKPETNVSAQVENK